MKRITFFIMAVAATTFLNAQSVSETIDYTAEDLNGSARVQGTGGAFLSLGGDVSSLSLNPAASAVNINTLASVSLGVFDNINDASYFNNVSRAIDTDASLNQGGAVFVFYNDNGAENSGWNKIAFGINYNNTRNHDTQRFVTGRSNTSIANYFVNRAQGIPLELLQLQNNETISGLYQFLGETEGTAAQDALLGFQGFIIDPLVDDPANTSYISNLGSGNFDQEYLETTRGYNGKYTANFSAQYNNDFYFGFNLNSHTINRTTTNSLVENNTVNSPINQIYFENRLSTYGAGVSAQIGGIAKFDKNFRVGFTYDTPTWYEINEETIQFLETERTVDNSSITATIDPNILNVFREYQLRTPGKIAAGASYVFGKKGFLSFDYTYKDYGNINVRYNDDRNAFSDLNSAIENNLQATSTFKVGGEYRYNEAMSFRAGIRHEQSPYKDDFIQSDLNGYSLGFGYNFGNYTLDIAYSYAEQERNNTLYSTGLTQNVNTQNQFSQLIFTFGFTL